MLWEDTFSVTVVKNEDFKTLMLTPSTVTSDLKFFNIAKTYIFRAYLIILIFLVFLISKQVERTTIYSAYLYSFVQSFPIVMIPV